MSPSDPIQGAGFDSLGLAEPLVQAVAALGYTEPTPIQREAIPPLIAGSDLLGLAATGTGKTAAFTLPLLHRLADSKGPGPRALVLTPTRELAVQVAHAVETYGKSSGTRVLAVYGGSSFGDQARLLKRGVDVVVATPGRALDHLHRGTMTLEHVQVAVLDEADEMLDMGFQEDIEELLGAVPETRQIALFSATFPRRLRHVAAKVLRDPVRVEVQREATAEGEAPRVRMVAHLVRRQQKPAALARLLEVEAPEAALVFCRTRDNVDALTEELARRGHRAEGLHGGLSQVQRDRVMARLRAGTVDVVLATDVAARGLDVDHLTHVFNVDMPEAPEPFVHRVGRVGRAGREGVAISFVEPNQRRLVVDIERRMGMPILREPLPTAADQRAKRRSRLVERVRHMAAQADLDAWKELVEQLTGDDLPLQDVAAAALRALADVTTADAPIEDIPDMGARRRPEGRPDNSPPVRRGGPAPRWARVFLNVGREAGVRPKDLFGAILGETQLERGDVGSIEIRARFAVVEVPEGAVEHVCDRMSQATLRGRPVHARPDGQQGR